jgi:hypothetical protein
MKFKMAAMAGLSLTFNDHSGQFGFNCPSGFREEVV